MVFPKHLIAWADQELGFSLLTLSPVLFLQPERATRINLDVGTPSSDRHNSKSMDVLEVLWKILEDSFKISADCFDNLKINKELKDVICHSKQENTVESFLSLRRKQNRL